MSLPRRRRTRGRRDVAWLAIVLGLVAFISPAIAAHFIEMLFATDLRVDAAPSNARQSDAGCRANHGARPCAPPARRRGTLAFALMEVSRDLHADPRYLIAALAFVIPYGWLTA